MHISPNGWLTLSTIFCLLGCGGAGTDPSEDIVTVTTSDPMPNDDLDTEDNNAGPEVTLLGEGMVTLSLGEHYTEEGALASDDEDGDISLDLSIIGSVDVHSKADYLLRYQVTDSGGKTGEAMRIVRVYDAEPVRQTARPADLTSAELGYLEHLPPDYNGAVDYSAPLIIFNHGSGATGGNLSAVECCGLPATILYDSWDNRLPFVILSPQRQSGLDTQALDEFIEYALANYHVDPERIYLTGWSQGANVSLRYVVLYPDKISAVVPIAGGWFQGVPSNVCDAAGVPMWSFVGLQDSNLITSTGIEAANAINNCGPSERAKLTNYLEGTHFSTSLWPFIPSETHQVSAASDIPEPDLFTWFLSLEQ